MLLYTVVRNILGYVQLVFTQNTGSSEIRFKVSMYIYICILKMEQLVQSVSICAMFKTWYMGPLVILASFGIPQWMGLVPPMKMAAPREGYEFHQSDSTSHPHVSRVESWAMWSKNHPNIYPHSSSHLPSGNLLHSYGKWPSYSWFTYEKWWFSIANC